MDDYKPLTPERITAAAAKGADCTLLLKDYSFSMPAFARAIERAAIENYLAQREPADAWLLTLRSLLNELRRLFGSDAREGIDLLEKRLRETEGRIDYLARKVCFTGIGDGSAHMHIINLPDAKHFPENGEYKRLFLDTIDAAIAAAKGPA